MIFLRPDVDVLLTVFFRYNVLLGKLTQCVLCFSTWENNARHYWSTGNTVTSVPDQDPDPLLLVLDRIRVLPSTRKKLIKPCFLLMTCKDPDPSVNKQKNNKKPCFLLFLRKI